MAKTIIGVMGPGSGATKQDITRATELGRQIALNNWMLLTGGRDLGVMNAASKGAHEAGGLVIGVLPSTDKKDASGFVDIPICTGMGSARNNINILSSDVVVSCGVGAGTISEVMLALKSQKPLILLDPSENLLTLIAELNYPTPQIAKNPGEAIQHITKFL